MAAIVMAVNPISIIYPGMILPDTLLTLFLVASSVLLYHALQDARRKNRYLTFAASGAVAGFAYMCKEPGILMVPIVGAYLFLFPCDGKLRERLIAPLIFMVSFLVVFLFDGLVYIAYTGDFFYKITATAFCHNQERPHLDLAGFLQTTVGDFVEAFKNGSFFLVPLHLGFPVMVMASMVDRRTRIFSLIGLFTLLYLIFGSSSLSELVSLPLQARYFQPVIPFVAIAVGVIVERYSFFRSRVAQVAFPCALGCLVAFYGTNEVFLRAGTQYESNLMKSFRTAVEVLAEEQKPLYVDPALYYNARHFLPRALYNRLVEISASDPLKKGYYFIYPELTWLPQDRFEEVKGLNVKLRVALDWRIANQFRQMSDSRILPPYLMRELLVYEKEYERESDKGTQKSIPLPQKKDEKCRNRM
jgi:hypothetical protein